ncbi:MAG: YqgE/AlgH family protein, partial [Sediminibacterium sp.]|nr:YqgE/AlgH family protein [Sediminibacterium sp.]
FILNKKTDQILGDVVEIADGLTLPVFEGGPVEQQTLHFIHRRPDIITEGIEISTGIYWGGDFDVAIAALHNKEITDSQIRFFIGYSGWSAGQLQEEVEEKSWIITTPDVGISFSLEAEQIWKRSMQQLGGEYAQMTNYPIDPQLN